MAQSFETAGGSLSWKATTSPREVVFNARVFIRHEQFLSPYYSPENVDVIFRCLDAAGVASTEPLIIGGTIDLQQNIWAGNPNEPAGKLTLSVREGGLASVNSSGTTVWGTSSIAMGLNGHGVVVGSAHEPLTGSSGAFVWRKGWPMLRRLDELVYPTTPGWQLKEAYGVNDSGMIVGWGYYNGIARAFVAVPGTPPPPPEDPEYNP